MSQLTSQRFRNERHPLLAITAKKEEPEMKKSKPISATLKWKIMFKWKEEFPWLTIREGNDEVFCSICCQVLTEAGKAQFITGCKSHKKETMPIHGESNGHLCAQRALLSQQKPVCETTFKVSLKERRPYKKGTAGK